MISLGRLIIYRSEVIKQAALLSVDAGPQLGCAGVFVKNLQRHTFFMYLVHPIILKGML
jgi:hypothetical protein